MSSVSFVDILTELFSYSSKMKGDSPKLSSSCLMNSNSCVPYPQRPFLIDLLNGMIGDVIVNSETTNPGMPLKQSLGLLGGNYSFSFLNTKKSFSPHLSKLSLMDAYHYSHASSELRFQSDKMLVSHMNNLRLNQSSEMNQSLKSVFDLQKTFVPPLSEIKIPTSVSQSKKKSDMSSSKCIIPSTSTLNKELANRKTKEMQKRSKKRRRRQKKNQQFDCSSSASVSDDEVDSKISSSITSCVCVVSENTKFGRRVAVSHSVMVPNALPSCVPVDTASDDDSEWESYGVDQCDSSLHPEKKADGNNLLASVSLSSQGKNENPDSKSEHVDCEYPSLISSFMVTVECSSDDESEWEACETDIFNETPEFEFAGLCITNLHAPQTPSFDTDYTIIVSSEDEDDDEMRIRIHLQEVNKMWNESIKGVEVKPKSPSKVSFAPDEALEVFPVDVYERKGEWETYATERLRFKRKIDELEKILSPCFNPEHRSKVFKKIHEPVL